MPPTLPELSRGLLWSTFLDKFAGKVDPEAIVMSPKRIVAWRDGDALNRLELLRWTWPDSRFSRAPRVTRIGLNTQWFIPPKTLLRRFGFEPWSRPPGTPRLTLEWSVLSEELIDFADWLPLWI